MKVENFEKIINQYKEVTKPTDRYASFDYCYNYFKTNENFNADMEKSCMILGFYLASWGMLRGSSFLLQKSAKYFVPVIEYYQTLDKSIWAIDVDSYSDKNIELIIEIYNKTKELIIEENERDLTLITKILLGVFGFIPAFDQYFRNTFKTNYKEECGFTAVNKKSLGLIKKFYEENKESINHLCDNTYTIDFLTGEKTKIKYPKAKIIDMYGFEEGKNVKS